jgi:MFS family permease
MSGSRPTTKGVFLRFAPTEQRSLNASVWRQTWYPAYGILGALTSLVAILLPIAMARASFPPFKIGVVMSALNLGLLLSPIWGRLADRTRMYRAIFSFGFILLGASFAGFCVTRGALVWTVVAFLQGIGVAAVSTVASLLVVVSNSRADWDRHIGWLQGHNTAGQVAGLALAGLLSSTVGLELGLLLSVVAIFLALRVRCETTSSAVGPHTAAFAHPTRLARRTELFTRTPFHHLDALALLADLHEIVLSRFGRFLIAWFFLSAATSAFFSLYPVMMPHVYGISAQVVVELYAGTILLTLPLYSLVGRWSERFGAGRMFEIGAGARTSAFLALGLLAFAPFTAASPLVLVSFAALQGLWPFLGVSAIDLAARLSQFGEGAGIGMLNGAGALAGALGAVIGGFSAQSFGYWSVPFLGAGGAALCWALSTRMVRRIPPRHAVARP